MPVSDLASAGGAHTRSQSSTALGGAVRLRLPGSVESHLARLHDGLWRASLWPFSERWYSWDIVFIIEPVLLVILTLGLIVPGLFILVNEEIGARQKGPQGRLAATLALLGVFVFWGLCDYEHRRAVAALEARTYEGADPMRVSAFPYMMNPFRWYGVVDTPAFFARTNADSLAPEVDPEGGLEIRYKPEETPVTLAAKKSYLGRLYLDWARYPVTETEELVGGDRGKDNAAYVVRFRDLRYVYPGGGTRAVLSASVLLDRDLRVVSEQFGMRGGGR
jgi:inner membrane protein